MENVFASRILSYFTFLSCFLNTKRAGKCKTSVNNCSTLFFVEVVSQYNRTTTPRFAKFVLHGSVFGSVLLRVRSCPHPFVFRLNSFSRLQPVNKSSFDFQNNSFEFVELVWVAQTAFPSPKHQNMKVFEMQTHSPLTSGYADSEYAFKWPASQMLEVFRSVLVCDKSEKV